MQRFIVDCGLCELQFCQHEKRKKKDKINQQQHEIKNSSYLTQTRATTDFFLSVELLQRFKLDRLSIYNSDI